ncbi:hypothetical protein [Bacillus sp. JJ722]|uniref:hypothetical protein n=1 Tax=Bacillus sp. JJ722 TaxID=3122973 RepID=UPI002FFF24FD
MSWLNEEIAASWRREGKRYATAINEYVRIGMESDWQQDQKEPDEDERSRLAADIVEMIRAANQAGDIERLREEIPPASWPITSEFHEEMQAIRPVAFMKKGSVIVHAGSSRERGTLYLIQQDDITELSELHHVGCSSDGNYFALVNQQGIRIVREMDSNLEGEETAVFIWKDIQNSIKASIPNLESLADEEHPEDILLEVIPFDDGKQLLLVCYYGIFILGSGQIEMIYPDVSELMQYDCEDSFIDMAHGAVSPDGRWIAYGSQGSEHLLKDLSDGAVYEFAPESSYPHYAFFSYDSLEVWYNACHFYNGSTIRVPVTAVEQNTSEIIEEWPCMNDEMRVYSAAVLKNGHILGDAYGYLRYIDRDGQEVWRYYVGSTISGMTVTPNEEKLAVGTYAGMLHLIDLNGGCKSEYSIGTADILETSRWILWQNQNPLQW